MLSDILAKVAETTGRANDGTADRAVLLRRVNKACSTLRKIWILPNTVREDFMCFDTLVSHDYVTPEHVEHVFAVRQSTMGERIRIQDHFPRYFTVPWKQPFNVWRNTGRRAFYQTPQMSSQLTIASLGTETAPFTVTVTGPTATSEVTAETITIYPGASTTTTNQFMFNDSLGIRSLAKSAVTVGDVSVTAVGLAGPMEIARIKNSNFDCSYLLWSLCDDKAYTVWFDNCFEVLYRETFRPLCNDTDVFSDNGYDDVVALQVQHDTLLFGTPNAEQIAAAAKIAEVRDKLMSGLTLSEEAGVTMEANFARNPFIGAQKRFGFFRRGFHGDVLR